MTSSFSSSYHPSSSHLTIFTIINPIIIITPNGLRLAHQAAEDKDGAHHRPGDDHRPKSPLLRRRAIEEALLRWLIEVVVRFADTPVGGLHADGVRKVPVTVVGVLQAVVEDAVAVEVEAVAKAAAAAVFDAQRIEGTGGKSAGEAEVVVIFCGV